MFNFQLWTNCILQLEKVCKGAFVRFWTNLGNLCIWQGIFFVWMTDNAYILTIYGHHTNLFNLFNLIKVDYTRPYASHGATRTDDTYHDSQPCFYSDCLILLSRILVFAFHGGFLTACHALYLQCDQACCMKPHNSWVLLKKYNYSQPHLLPLSPHTNPHPDPPEFVFNAKYISKVRAQVQNTYLSNITWFCRHDGKDKA